MDSTTQDFTAQVDNTDNTKETQKDSTDLHSPGKDYSNDYLFHRAAQFFRLHPQQIEENKFKLSYVLNWAKIHTKAKSTDKIISLLEDLQYHGLRPQIGETELDVAYRYLRILKGR